MRNTRSRIEALERDYGSDVDDLTVTIKRLGTRPNGEPPQSYSTPGPVVQRVHREPDESHDAFHERARKILRRGQRGCFVMLED
jgi:hypothetical protein